MVNEALCGFTAPIIFLHDSRSFASGYCLEAASLRKQISDFYTRKTKSYSESCVIFGKPRHIRKVGISTCPKVRYFEAQPSIFGGFCSLTTYGRITDTRHETCCGDFFSKNVAQGQNAIVNSMIAILILSHQGVAQGWRK